jgi:hypothetical protein
MSAGSSTTALLSAPPGRFLSQPVPGRGRTPAVAGTSGTEGDGMRLLGRLRRRGDLGMTTAEYAVGTVAACGFGGLLYKILTSETIMHLLEGLISKALHFFG